MEPSQTAKQPIFSAMGSLRHSLKLSNWLLKTNWGPRIHQRGIQIKLIKSMKIKLIDTFNGTLISTHLSLENAVKAQRKHAKAIERRNGQGSYLTYGFKYENGKSVDQDSVMQAKMDLDNSQW